MIISREIGDDEWHIDEIMTIVEREISARERAFSSSSNETRGSGLPTAVSQNVPIAGKVTPHHLVLL